ncbi:GntP family permease [Nocardioides massiliensis]|uniref:GntP family gluconate:H+ symporter n=1 Tax=Nocardioides massiliensis TaxID=1325935 RepID=A0ABT9NPT7_9ACTN|nr:GntP family permease [Nocardioides massiliensis]MDP9822443.1 GntP family gluconate:H+ symporter [Nocardioides massiliensis]
MDALEPAYSTPVMLLIALGAVVILLTLIMVVRLHAFVALVLVSLVTALVAGIPIGDIPDVMLQFFGSTLGSVALLVALGVMLGRVLEVTGGAQVLADTLIGRFGEKRAPLALGVAALIFGFPIFFDAGLVVFLPIIMTVARRFGGSVLLYALPAAGAFAAMHAIVPPHPGPVAAADSLEASIGLTLLTGLGVALVSWFVGVYLLSRFLGARIHVPVSDLLFGEIKDDKEADGASRPPAFAVVLSLLLLPMLLISLNTVVDTLLTAGTIDEAWWTDTFLLIGQTPVALLISLLATFALLGSRVGSRNDLQQLVDDALGPICSIILITGAGGMFGGVLRTSGIGESLTGALGDVGIPLLLQAFLIAAALRVAQGSATVALTTAAGLVAAGAGGLSELQLVALVFAIAGGSTVLSHVNDSGFWLVSRFFGMDEKTTLKTWTVMETTLGTMMFVCSAVIWTIG